MVDGEEVMEVRAELVLKLGLKSELELSQEQLQEIRNEEEYLRARELALGYLALRVRSERELFRYLKKKGIGTTTIEGLLEYLREKGEVNDGEFARKWVRERKKLKPCGPRLLEKELREKGVEEGVVRTALGAEGMYDLDYQRSVGRELLQKRYALPLRDKKEKKRARDYLLRLGFEGFVVGELLGAGSSEGNEGEEG